jgi:diaminopimelate decarboxylase
MKIECAKHDLPLPKLIMEPGRSIVGKAGVTLYTVGAVKEIPQIKNYIFVDGGMADNPRPIMYQASYTFELANKAAVKKEYKYSIAGKFCESGDVLGKDIHLPKAETGDLLAVYATGAYNYAMSSNYNRFCKPAMVLVKQGQAKLIVKREDYADIIRNDIL